MSIAYSIKLFTPRKICQARLSGRCYIAAVVEQEYRNHINQVIKAIIRNPGEDWTTAALAGLAGISAFHFHRVFRALTGETMFAFLQRRRLLRAIELMQENRFSLTEIALECGFDSGSSLSRAFKKHCGCSPTEYRRQHPALFLPAARPLANRKAVIEAEIREISERQALIVERRGLIEQNFEHAAKVAFRVLVNEIKHVNGWPAIRECIGICPDEASLVPDAEARYQAGFIYEGQLPDLSTEVQRLVIPAGKWAVALHSGGYDTLWQSWNRMYRNWLPISGYVLRDAAPFEIYLNNLKTVSPEKLQTQIWIPIQ